MNDLPTIIHVITPETYMGMDDDDQEATDLFLETMDIHPQDVLKITVTAIHRG